MLNNLCFNKFAQNSSPRAVLALGLLLAVFGPGPGKDGPGRPENSKPTQFDMLNNICFKNFAWKSSPVSVLALGLLLAVFVSGPGPDGPGCLEKTLNQSSFTC